MKVNGKSKVETRALNLYYGKLHVLKDINIKVPSNQITALIGPSGCGKSSFLRVLNRMNDLVRIAFVEGEIFIDGVNIYDNGIDVANLRKNVGMVFQEPNPFPVSVYDNVAYGPRIHGIKKRSQLDEIVEESLKLSALWNEVKDRLRSPARSLSGGQQQRLCIARLLAVKPDILLMDEPSSALDPSSTLKIEELIKKLKLNYSIIIVTHNMQQAARVSDSTAFFLHGEMIEYDTTDTIFTNPKDKRTEDYITGRFG